MTDSTVEGERRTPAVAYFWLVCVAGIVVTAIAAVATLRTPTDGLVLLLLVAALAATIPAPLHARFRTDTISLLAEEIFILPGLLLLPGPALVLAVAAGHTVARSFGMLWSPAQLPRVFFRSRRVPFNIAHSSLAAAAAVAVGDLLQVGGGRPLVARLGAALVATVVFSLVSRLLVAGMIASVSGRSLAHPLLEDVGVYVLVSVLLWSVGAFLGLAVLTQPFAPLWIVAAAALVLAGSSITVRGSHQRERLALLLQAASDVHRSVDRREVEAAVEHAAATLLDCHRSALRVSPPADHELGVELSHGTWLAVSQPRSSYSTFDDRDRELLDALGAIAAPALEHAHRVADLRVADDLKAAVLASISHDLRGPLATATGIAELLVEQDEALALEERRTLARGVRTAVNRVDRLVNGLLELERYELGRLPEPADAEIGAVVADAVAALPRRTDVVVEGDRVRARIDAPALERAVENLLTNAAKHSPGDAEIVVRHGRRDGLAWLVVEDAGPGVPEGRREEIFEPFQHGERPGAVGLGLWVARRFVELRDGHIWVETSPAGGAAFHVTLPLA